MFRKLNALALFSVPLLLALTRPLFSRPSSSEPLRPRGRSWTRSRCSNDFPRAKARSVPEDAPTEFVRRRWASHVFTEVGLDRRYYELCALTELRNALRSGDVWVPGSRQFKDFEDYLLPTGAFEALLRSDSLPVIAGSFDRYWTERETLLRRELQKVDGLAARHELPDADFVDGILKVTPQTSAVQKKPRR